MSASCALRPGPRCRPPLETAVGTVSNTSRFGRDFVWSFEDLSDHGGVAGIGKLPCNDPNDRRMGLRQFRLVVLPSVGKDLGVADPADVPHRLGSRSSAEGPLVWSTASQARNPAWWPHRLPWHYALMRRSRLVVDWGGNAVWNSASAVDLRPSRARTHGTRTSSVRALRTPADATAEGSGVGRTNNAWSSLEKTPSVTHRHPDEACEKQQGEHRCVSG